MKKAVAELESDRLYSNGDFRQTCKGNDFSIGMCDIPTLIHINSFLSSLFPYIHDFGTLQCANSVLNAKKTISSGGERESDVGHFFL